MKKRKKKGITYTSAQRKVSRLEKLPEYRGCYFYIDELSDGSYEVIYTDPGLGVGW